MDSALILNTEAQKKIRAAALSYLSRREYSRKELFLLLAKKFSCDEFIHLVLDDLEDQDIQSDSRYAEILIRNRVSKKQGPIRIRNELREKGISNSLIEANLDHYSEADWLDVIVNLSNSKYGSHPISDDKERAKRLRFFQYRGFDLSLIYQVI